MADGTRPLRSKPNPKGASTQIGSKYLSPKTRTIIPKSSLCWSLEPWRVSWHRVAAAIRVYALILKVALVVGMHRGLAGGLRTTGMHGTLLVGLLPQLHEVPNLWMPGVSRDQQYLRYCFQCLPGHVLHCKILAWEADKSVAQRFNPPGPSGNRSNTLPWGSK